MDSSIKSRRISSHRRSNRRLIGPSQPSPDHFDECAISLKSELPGFGIERRLVRHECQLVLHESPERLGNEVELPRKLLVGPVQSVESDAELFVELGGPAPLEPCTESVREDGGLRRAWLVCKRFELLRQVVGQVKLMPRLEGFHGGKSGVEGRLPTDAGGRTSLLSDEPRSDLRSWALSAKGPGNVPSAHDPG